MKKSIAILMLIILSGCESLQDCVQQTGDMTSKEVEVGAFDKIIVYRGISLVISEGPEYTVNIVSGEILMEDIEVKVENGVLLLRDNAECNWRRSYGATTIYVTSPTLTEIISKTEQKISSGNVLTYYALKLIANDLSDGAGTGDFHIEVDNHDLIVETNNVAGFYLSGETDYLSAAFFEGNGPLKAENLTAQYVYVFHRGSNNMYVRPVLQITGDIYSTGNVFCDPQPPVVDVEEHYQGQLFLAN